MTAHAETRTAHVQPPPHAPESGWVRRLLGPLHVTGVFWFKLQRFGVSILPNWALGLVINVFTSFFFLILVKIRRAVASNLEAVLGPCGRLEREKRIFRTLSQFAWCSSERYERLGAAPERQGVVEAEDWRIWEDLQDSGRGFVVITAHIGHWEIGSAFSGGKSRRKVHVVREEEMDPNAQKMIREMLAQGTHENVEVHFATRGSQLGTGLLKHLRQGEIVALQGDRPRTGSRTVEVEVFDRPFELPAGPAALARAAEVPLLPVFLFRSGRLKSRLVFRPPIEVVSDVPRGEQLQATMQKVAEEIEWAIREEPHQWFCFRELWPAADGAVESVSDS